jgi:hypothetical protein
MLGALVSARRELKRKLVNGMLQRVVNDAWSLRPGQFEVVAALIATVNQRKLWKRNFKKGNKRTNTKHLACQHQLQQDAPKRQAL